MSPRSLVKRRRIDGFDVPFTTISSDPSTRANGLNFVPAEAECFFACRFMVGMHPDATPVAIDDFIRRKAKALMQFVDPQKGICLIKVSRIPNLSNPAAEAIFRFFRDILSDSHMAKGAEDQKLGSLAPQACPASSAGRAQLNRRPKPAHARL